MDSLIGEVQDLESYSYRIEWDVLATLKSKMHTKVLFATSSPGSDSLDPPIFDGKLFTAWTDKDKIPISSKEFSSRRECERSSAVLGPKMSCRFHILRGGSVAVVNQIYVLAELQCDTDFDLASASVSYRPYHQTDCRILSYYCDPKEPVIRLELTNPTNKSKRIGSDDKFGQTVNVTIDTEKANFKSLNFNFVLFPKVDTSGTGTTHNSGRLSDRSRCVYPCFLFSPDYSDVTISCGSKDYPAHKIVICSKSKVLERMFAQPLAESLAGRTNMDDSEPEIVEEFLRFLYTGVVTDLAKNASGLLLIADKYDVQDLKVLSEKAILNSLADGNVLELYEFGNLVNSEPIIRQCVERIKMNKNSIWKSDEEVDGFCKKHPELLRKVLGFNFPTSPNTPKLLAHHEENGAVDGGDGKRRRIE